MIPYPDIDPVAIALGPLEIRWYGISYLAAFACAWWLGNRRAGATGSDWTREQVADLIFYGALGAVLGGRVGYVLFYGFERLMADPLYLFAIREGGMSFHGGLLGVGIALVLFGRRTHRSFLQVADFTAPLVPVGLGFGRLGNFANLELPGRVTDLPWALVWPGEVIGRHPSSLYQAFAEGLVLFALVWGFSRIPRPAGSVSGIFLAGYGVLRFTTEFFRKPDDHLGFVAFDWMSMGQVLCIPMVVGGLALLWWSHARQSPALRAGRQEG